jgi:oxalate decarboxylase/phosphoglucose isomerase-like protein (cupin superfamily)
MYGVSSVNESSSVVLTPEQIKAAATIRVDRAMNLIEQAQNNLASACAELSAIEGGVTVWSMCHKLTDRVHTFWYRVQRFRSGGKYRLDGTHIEDLKNSIAKSRQTELGK